MDCGFKFEETEGLFSKSADRKGMTQSEPLDRKPVAEIRLEREERGTPAGYSAERGGKHGRWRDYTLAHTVRALEAMVQLGNSTGRERSSSRTHRRRKRGHGRIGDDVRHGREEPVVL
jgi:hypothetical protein